MEDLKRLQKHVESIVKDIENGLLIDKDDIEGGYYDQDYQEGDIMSAYDYLNDVLDIEYTINSDRTYKGARVLVSFGGPNIWINTLADQVEGYWWGDKSIISYNSDAMGLDDALRELYEMGA